MTTTRAALDEARRELQHTRESLTIAEAQRDAADATQQATAARLLRAEHALREVLAAAAGEHERLLAVLSVQDSSTVGAGEGGTSRHSDGEGRERDPTSSQGSSVAASADHALAHTPSPATVATAAAAGDGDGDGAGGDGVVGAGGKALWASAARLRDELKEVTPAADVAEHESHVALAQSTELGDGDDAAAASAVPPSSGLDATHVLDRMRALIVAHGNVACQLAEVIAYFRLALMS